MTSRDILFAPAPPSDERVAYGPDPAQYGELYLPPGAGPHPVVVALHGGFWRAEFGLAYMGHLAAALREAGSAVWNVEYRRVGQQGGGWPGTFHDVAAAMGILTRLAPVYGLDLDRVVTTGHSAGGHLALWLAARRRIPPGDPLYDPAPPPVLAAVAVAGVVDLHEARRMRLDGGAVDDLLGGSPVDYPTRYEAASPAALLPFHTPQVLIHGTGDDRVPYQISRTYYTVAAERGDPVRLVALRDADHFTPVNPRTAAGARVVAEIRLLLDYHLPTEAHCVESTDV